MKKSPMMSAFDEYRKLVLKAVKASKPCRKQTYSFSPGYSTGWIDGIDAYENNLMKVLK